MEGDYAKRWVRKRARRASGISTIESVYCIDNGAGRASQRFIKITSKRIAKGQ